MKTILVVDDEFGIADTLSSILTDEGYSVVVAINGEQGLTRMGEVMPDLVIVDFMMPVKSGPEMVREMRASDALSGIPVIMMSAVSEAMVREECEFAAFLRKPFDLETLLRTVVTLIGEPGSR
jgi:CheY-like chemotaxis protein